MRTIKEKVFEGKTDDISFVLSNDEKVHNGISNVLDVQNIDGALILGEAIKRLLVINKRKYKNF